VECVGVGTGGVDPRTLLELGACHAFLTLAEPGVHEALLGAGRGSPARASP
jgi:hypothetical protein